MRSALRQITIWLVLLAAWPSSFVVAGGWSWQTPPHLMTLDPGGRRSAIFYVGEPVTFQISGTDATHFEVRDYYGNLVDKGHAGFTLTSQVKQPGWYKLYLYGDQDQGEPWHYIVGGTMFAIVRRDPHFPPLPSRALPPGGDGIGDQPTRDILGMGPERLSVQDVSKPDEAIQKLEAEIAIDKALYLPYDPYRKRALLVAFPNGTNDLSGVRQIVEHFQHDVQYWEPRNEPNFGRSGADFAKNEMKPFYETVKAVNPHLKVLGPGTVSIGPPGGLLHWIEDFLKAGGGKYIDGFSFHAYNTVNGDVWLARKALDTLQALLAKYGLGSIEKWQTEQGYFAAVYGAYQPSHQGRWTMVQMMTYEQYGIPKEHNHYWYDKSHGFWDQPTWWENDDGGVNPAAVLMRVWAEELYGTRFQRAYDFGANGNKIYIGSLFTGPGKRVAALLSAGDTQGSVTLKVTGGSKLRLVSAFGVARSLPVQGGQVQLSVPELPVYVELSTGQSLQVVPQDWGHDLALAPGVTAAASGTGVHPVDPTIHNDIAKVHNGALENWYWSQQKDDQPWMDNTPQFPAWVELRFPKPQKIARVVIYAGVPWQWMGSLLDYELEYDAGGQWKTLAHVDEPTNTFKVYTPPTRTTVDSFYRDRWIFQHHFAPVTTQKIRLLVHDATWGGGATKDVADAGGQTGPHQINLREIEVYAR